MNGVAIQRKIAQMKKKNEKNTFTCHPLSHKCQCHIFLHQRQLTQPKVDRAKRSKLR